LTQNGVILALLGPSNVKGGLWIEASPHIGLQRVVGPGALYTIIGTREGEACPACLRGR
jgi:hypothetical protein